MSEKIQRSSEANTESGGSVNCASWFCPQTD